MKLITFILFLFVFALIAPMQTGAQEVFRDDFNSGNLDKWQDVRETFDLWDLTESAAHVFIDKRSTLAELIPKPEYWNPNWKNYSFEVQIKYIQGVDNMLAFWFQDILNWYQIHFVGSNYILSHIADGKEVWKQVAPISFPLQSLMRVELIDGEISLYINNKHIFTHTDPTFDNDHGSIALKAGAGAIFPSEVMFDSVSVNLISASFVALEVPFFAQNDLSWSENEYNAANKWSPDKTTIQDWGCLVSSIAMILKYNEIEQLPSGDPITPASLNEWLKNQDDGFLGEGLVNWSAITRLVREIHNIHGTTKLEYKKIIDDQFRQAAKHLSKSIPVIFQIPGHFLVGTGLEIAQEVWTAENFSIQDPLYPYSKLSEHKTQQSKNENEFDPLVSTRVLVPSNTNLSYLYIAYPEKVKVELNSAAQNSFESYSIGQDFLTSSDKQNTTSITTIHEIQKPRSGEFDFTLTVEAENTSEIVGVTIYAYDAEANLTNLGFDLPVVSGAQLNFTISYSDQNTSTITYDYNFSDFLADLELLFSQGFFATHFAPEQLIFLAKKAAHFENKLSTEDFNLELKQRYLVAFNSELDWHASSIEQSAQVFLNQRLTMLAHN